VSDSHLAARRRQILDGAPACFAEYGYDKATVRRLEQTIGLSRGAIFHHSRTRTRCSSSWPTKTPNGWPT
jgi:TetR/AcrR family transcriptional regulator, transcriptional repressor of aconitase